MGHRYSRLGLALVLLLALSGSACGAAATRAPATTATILPSTTPAATQPPTAAPTEAPAATATITAATATIAATATVAPTATPTATAALPDTPTPVPATAYEGWLEYSNPTYGFSLRYPPDWTLAEEQNLDATMWGHRVYLVPDDEPEAMLNVGFRHLDEDQRISRTGLGSGEIVPAGSVTFLGEPVKRETLVDQAGVMTVLYAGCGEIHRGDLAFTLAMDFMGDWAAGPGLSERAEATADLIVASLVLSQ